ncbi:MAG: hypothetical protein JRE23_14960 [Deltaproteobacteria bacterium]|nr:hypothetical protein [Deltaproteobacteria bacterium]
MSKYRYGEAWILYAGGFGESSKMAKKRYFYIVTKEGDVFKGLAGGARIDSMWMDGVEYLAEDIWISKKKLSPKKVIKKLKKRARKRRKMQEVEREDRYGGVEAAFDRCIDIPGVT